MSRLRVKLILNEGGEGVPLAQLSDIASEAEKFLRYLAHDAGLNVQRGDWLARNFVNQSVRFDIEREAFVPLDEIKEFNRKFEIVDAIRAGTAQMDGEVRHRTLVQFTRVAEALGPHEKLAFGLYRASDLEEENPYKFAPLSKREATQLAAKLSEEITYSGTIQGHVHSIGVAELFFQLRRLRTNELIRCEFKEDLYDHVLEACERRNSRLFVHGRITARRVDRHVSLIKVDRLKSAPQLSEERYEAFFGADPKYTGDLESDEFAEVSLRYEQ